MATVLFLVFVLIVIVLVIEVAVEVVVIFSAVYFLISWENPLRIHFAAHFVYSCVWSDIHVFCRGA